MKLKVHERNINIVRFNYDGDLLFSGDADRLINVFEAYTGERLGSYSAKTAVKTLDVDIDSKYLIYASFDGTVQVSTPLMPDVRCENWRKLEVHQFHRV